MSIIFQNQKNQINKKKIMRNMTKKEIILENVFINQ